MMKRLFLFLCFLLFSGSLMANGSISGIVTAGLGVPLPAATVTLLRGSDTVVSATTSALDGSYSFSAVSAGEYIVRTSLLTFQTAVVGVTVVDGQNSTANFSLAPNPGAISGQVLNLTPAPIAGAIVHAIQNDILIGSTTADGSGDYTINGLAAGSYVVTAAASGYQTSTTGGVVLAGQTTTVSFSLLSSPGTISGTVRSANGGMPISNALIQVSSGDTVIYAALTNGSGVYAITGVAAGSYTVTAASATYDTRVTGATVISGSTTTVDFSLLASPGTISGTVTSKSTGLPISGALVEVNLASIVIGSAVTDNSGNYMIFGVAPGSYIVDAYAADYQTSTTGAIVVSNQTTTVNFSLQSSRGTLSGSVTSSLGGASIAGALIQISNGDAVIDSTFTDNSGHYTILGIAPGSYTIIASSPTYDAGITGAIISANITSTVNFSLQSSPGSISGTVVDTLHSLPISGALIEVTLNNMVIFSTLTDNAGSYSITGVSPGTYIVHAYATNYQTGSVGALVVSNTTTTVALSLEGVPVTITGTVTSAATGLPISGALVKVSLSSIVVDSAVTDSSGKYSISGMPPGSYIVDAYSANYQTGTVGVIVPSSDTSAVDFSLQSNPGSIIGTVTSEHGGLPISGALIEVSLNDVVIFSILTDSSGNYSISGISPDVYTVDAFAANYQARTTSSSVSSNQTTRVNFTLQSSPGTIYGTVIDAMGSLPISGALVEVNLNNTLIFSTLTDSSGNYSISGVAPNTYAVHTHAATYQTAINRSVVVTSNMTTIVDFSLQSNPGLVKGTITDSVTGLPLSGVFVDIFEDGIFIDVAVTDSAGNYVVSGLAPDSYTLSAIKVNYDTRNFSFIVTAGAITTVNLTMIPNFPPRNLTGTVIVNAFLLQADRIHRLQWAAALGGNISNYRVYRNGAFLAKISPNALLQYDDHNRSSKVQDNYAVTAVNTSGNESASVSSVLQ